MRGASRRIGVSSFQGADLEPRGFRFRLPHAVLACVCGLFSIGCGSDQLETVAVSGTVTYDGQPLENGIVRFVPTDKEGGRMATGRILEGGRFTMATAGSDGVLPGEYKISIQSQKMTKDVPAKDRELGIGGKESAIPRKYNDPETSGLRETVDGPRTIQFDLKSN